MTSSGIEPATFRLVAQCPITNEYEEYFLGCKGGRCVGLTTLPPSYADCHDIREPHPPGTLRACLALHTDCFTFALWYSALYFQYICIAVIQWNLVLKQACTLPSATLNFISHVNTCYMFRSLTTLKH